MSGMGFDGGDGYRCRFGRLGPSRWFVDRQNEVVADLINMDTLRCTSPNASMAMSYGVLYEEFDAVARGHMRYSDLRGDAILQGGNLSQLTEPVHRRAGSSFSWRCRCNRLRCG